MTARPRSPSPRSSRTRPRCCCARSWGRSELTPNRRRSQPSPPSARSCRWRCGSPPSEPSPVPARRWPRWRPSWRRPATGSTCSPPMTTRRTPGAAGGLLAPGRRHVPLDPPPPECRPLTLAGYEQALEWCDAEHAGVVACVRSAAQTGHDDIAWQLPVASFGYFDLRKPWAEWIACARIALSAARRCGDRFGQAWVLGNLGVAYVGLGRFADSLDCGRESPPIPRDICT